MIKKEIRISKIVDCVHSSTKATLKDEIDFSFSDELLSDNDIKLILLQTVVIVEELSNNSYMMLHHCPALNLLKKHVSKKKVTAVIISEHSDNLTNIVAFQNLILPCIEYNKYKFFSQNIHQRIKNIQQEFSVEITQSKLEQLANLKKGAIRKGNDHA